MRLFNAISSVLVGLGLVSSANLMAAPKWAKKGDKLVKCKGIAKKGKNDCGANNHACSGMAKKDGDPNEWIYLPEGVCEKIVNGVVLKTKGMKMKKK